MSKRLFAPGDEIVVVNANMFRSYENGDKGTIDSLLWGLVRGPKESGCWKVMLQTKQGLRRDWLNEEEMEHAAVVGSPLWEELK